MHRGDDSAAASGPLQGHASGRHLEQVIDGLETRLDELARSQRLTRLVILCGSVLLLGMMGLFGLSLYSTLKRQLSPTQVENAVMAKIDQIGPALGQKFIDSAIKAGPAYGELALKRFEKVRPRLESMALNEAEHFGERLQESMLKKSDAGMSRVGDRIAQDLKMQLPKLTETKLDAIGEILRTSLLIEGGGIADELQAKVAKERARVEKMLDQLPVDEVAKQSEDTLHRQFIHHVLMMIDESVAASEKPATPHQP